MFTDPVHASSQVLRRPRFLLAAALVAAGIVAGTLGSPHAAQAATITVNTTSDEFNTGPGCSLREAIRAANNDVAFGGCSAGSGPDTITFNVNGIFLITITPGPDENADAAGDFDLLSDITIQGNGAANTIVDGGSADRVFDIAPFGGPQPTIVLSGLTIQNGKAFPDNFKVGGGIYIGNTATVTINNCTLANNQSQANTGGAIENRGALTLNSVTLENNTAFGLGGAVYSPGALTANNSTFSGNKAESGGALYINTASTRTATITGSRFTGNEAVVTADGVEDSGGAIAINTDGQVTISGSTFTGNSAAANGGALYFNDSATEAAVAVLGLSYSRITGNTAAGAGSGLYRAGGTATAHNNWWGCNGGPSAAACDLVAGAASVTPWLVLSHTASPTPINTGQSAMLTASFLTNSDGSANTAGSLGALMGVPVSFASAVLGTISAAQTAIQANGTAAATYTAGTLPGAGSAAATVDGATVTANLTITRPATAVASITPNGVSPSTAVTVSWTVVFSAAISGITTNNFALETINLLPDTIVDVSGSGTTWTVTATVHSGEGVVQLDMINDDGLSHALNNLPFFGQYIKIDTVPPDTSLLSTPSDPSDSTTASFSFVGIDNEQMVDTFECQLDDSLFAACDSPVTYTGLAAGSHTFQVRAIDKVGHVAPIPATYTWTIVTGTALTDRLYLPLIESPN